MIAPTPRQQAGYLRRLLRRGEVQLVDPQSGRPVQALVELSGDTIRLTPMRSRAATGAAEDDGDAHWMHLLERLRKVVSREDAEALIAAVEAEQEQSELLQSFGS